MPLGRPRGRGSGAGVGCRERGNGKLLSDPLLILDPRCWGALLGTIPLCTWWHGGMA
jgi:hypothetical protein